MPGLLTHDELTELTWRAALAELVPLAEAARVKLAAVTEALRDVPRQGFVALYYVPETDGLAVSLLPGADEASWQKLAEPFDQETWETAPLVPLAVDRGLRQAALRHEKLAESKLLRGALGLAGYAPSFWTGPVPGAPGPVVGSLAGGLLGAGLGYGAGWLGSRLLPETWDRRNLPRTLALAGGALGAAPGLLGVADNLAAGRPWYDDTLFKPPAKTIDVFKLPNEALDAPVPPVIKQSFESVTGLLGPPPPPIPVDALQQAVWRDPLVAGQLTPQLRLATSGLAEAAWQQRQRETGESTRLIWPRDIARISAGMGSGYLSGAVVGKVLGTMLGMPPETQTKLRRTGLMAGAIANIIPMAFGGY